MQQTAKLALAACLALAIVVVYAYSAGRPEPFINNVLQSKLQGTWESLGSRPGMRQVKLISKNHFTWVFYDKLSGAPATIAGGTCTFTGDTYTEHVEFGSAGVQRTLVGHDQAFTVQFAGDRLEESGTLSNGMKLTEVWRRVE